MTTLTAREILKMEFGNSRNFMTPTVLEIGKINENRAYEISKGTGIFRDWIYGVSIVDYNPETGKTERPDNVSKMTDTLKEAREYIESLRGVS